MKKKHALITGITGQDGAYLAQFLLAKGYRVTGIAQRALRADRRGLSALGVGERVTLAAGDATNSAFLSRVVKAALPDEWYNLAAISSVRQSWEDPAAVIRINGEAVWRMLEIVRSASPRTKFFQASSAEIYGNADGVVTEKTRQFAPQSPYGVGKLAAHMAVALMRERYGLFAVCGILFNHESPLRPDTFVSKKIARAAARIAAGLDTHVELGNLRVRRDWGFAGDIVRAMWLSLGQKTPRDYVVSTGENYSIADFARAAFAHAGIRNWKSHVRVDPSLVRKYEIRDMRGSSLLAKRALGWAPTVPFHSLVAMMVDYEVAQLSKPRR